MREGRGRERRGGDVSSILFDKGEDGELKEGELKDREGIPYGGESGGARYGCLPKAKTLKVQKSLISTDQGRSTRRKGNGVRTTLLVRMP